MNARRMNKAINFIEANPRRWDQAHCWNPEDALTRDWRENAQCFGAWAARLSFTSGKKYLEHFQAKRCMGKKGYSALTRAETWLDLTEEQGDYLFEWSRSWPEIKAFAAAGVPA